MPLLNEEEKARFYAYSSPVEASFTALHQAVLKDDTSTLEKLLANDANLEATLPDGRTPLHLLCEYGKSENALKIVLDSVVKL